MKSESCGKAIKLALTLGAVLASGSLVSGIAQQPGNQTTPQQKPPQSQQQTPPQEEMQPEEHEAPPPEENEVPSPEEQAQAGVLPQEQPQPEQQVQPEVQPQAQPEVQAQPQVEKQPNDQPHPEVQAQPQEQVQPQEQAQPQEKVQPEVQVEEQPVDQPNPEEQVQPQEPVQPQAYSSQPTATAEIVEAVTIRGKVSSVEPNTLVVTDRNDTEQKVSVTPQTMVAKGGAKTTMADLQPNDFVRVVARAETNGAPIAVNIYVLGR